MIESKFKIIYKGIHIGTVFSKDKASAIKKTSKLLRNIRIDHEKIEAYEIEINK